MDATPTLTVTIGAHTVTITLPDKECAKVIANRCMKMCTDGFNGMDSNDVDAMTTFKTNVFDDIDND